MIIMVIDHLINKKDCMSLSSFIIQSLLETTTVVMAITCANTVITITKRANQM
jgi:hypothetical protein